MTVRFKPQDLAYTYTVVPLPHGELSEAIFDLAEPLLEPLGPSPAPDEVRAVLELAINLWNSHVLASRLWPKPKLKSLSALRKAMCGRQSTRERADTFKRLSARWQAKFRFDPRLVGSWSFDATERGNPRLVCETTLPDGVVAEVLPPAEKRIAVGGVFLDEVRARESTNMFRTFPFEQHSGTLGSDGTATIFARMPVIVELFARGVLKPVGGAPVDLMVCGKALGLMVLSEVSCTGPFGQPEISVLVFRCAETADVGVRTSPTKGS
jgi:hypothetical protein